MTTLDKVAAHETDNAAFDADLLPNQGQLLLVTQVQGIIFANNAADFRKYPSFFGKKSLLVLVKSGDLVYNNVVCVYITTNHKKINLF